MPDFNTNEGPSEFTVLGGNPCSVLLVSQYLSSPSAGPWDPASDDR